MRRSHRADYLVISEASASGSVCEHREVPPREEAGAPKDPVGFVRDAEAATNAYDVARTSAVYANDAVLETVTDGAREIHRGQTAIRAAWEVYLAAMRTRQFRLSKTLIARTDEVVVNEWVGGTRGRRRARGFELWRFAASGAVIEHRLYTFFDVRPSEGGLARFRALICSPGLTLAVLRNQRRISQRT